MSDLIDLYPATIRVRGMTLRLVSATGQHDADSAFNVLEVVHGLPCDGLTYMDDTERRGKHLVAVFHGETAERTAIAVCNDWKWKWFAVGDERVGSARESATLCRIVMLCVTRGDHGYADPPAGTLVGDYMRKAAA